MTLMIFLVILASQRSVTLFFLSIRLDDVLVDMNFVLHQHLQRRLAAQIRFLGVLEQLIPCIFICPALREQYDLRRLARAPVGFFSVTAVFSFEPGLRRRYAATPFFVMPAPLDVGRLCPLRTDMPFIDPFFAGISSLPTLTGL